MVLDHLSSIIISVGVLAKSIDIYSFGFLKSEEIWKSKVSASLFMRLSNMFLLNLSDKDFDNFSKLV